MQVGVNYDPMIAKVIARGPDRQSALRRISAALSELQVRSTSGFSMPLLPESAPTMPVRMVGRIYSARDQYIGIRGCT